MKNALQFIQHYWLHFTRKHYTSLWDAQQMQGAYHCCGVNTVAHTCEVCYSGFIITARKVVNQ
jgi:hypothetical protein